ncbi:uncharacterized protein SPPG_07784 [Spizellomyces punctatus DAOM BR117]|uniref:Uncharacterized protein n=1 Tax=Spizellomyces punctatus (strain DAOM BR117) TaxID=645134 RepID=A0A0L0H8E7_SPIPD|nr:uncharacterized protein SPPG_07784 [Spizellomyces punctatus DAOM BR117]KNC96963.1 hypothetical protein SPPG_07784 [Spizellomyces punctatus DAOM BR117]|eukprot:XP_016605003.1 hypothetical protein SPPG_07784 [Spizellomyces punctatus DAOM BR117]
MGTVDPQESLLVEQETPSSPNKVQESAVKDTTNDADMGTEQELELEKTEPAISSNGQPAELNGTLEPNHAGLADSDENLSDGPMPTPSGPRYPMTVAFGPRGGWYIRWSDGTSGWEHLPPTLHAKLNKRNSTLPGVRQMGMSDNNEWFVSFDDGSFATSGFPPRGRLFDALHNDADADVTNLVFAPGGGWLLTREDGTSVWERLPSGLSDLLKRRSKGDPPVDYVAISKLGGWFIRFEDRECEWEGLPPRLEKILIQTIRKSPKHLIVGLSPAEMNGYFIAVGTAYDTNIEHPNMRAALAWAREETTEDGSPVAQPEMNINYTVPLPSAPVASEEFEDLFRHAAGGDNSSTFGDNGGQDLDDDVVSSIGGGGSVVEVQLPSGSTRSSSLSLLTPNLEYAQVDGNVEAEEGGRLLLRAASGTLNTAPTQSKSRWSLGTSSTSTTSPAPAPATATAGLTSFFSSMSSVFSLSSGPKNETARGRSVTRGDARAVPNNKNSTSPNQQSRAEHDEYDGETDMMLDRVAQVKGQIQERTHPVFQNLDTLAYQLTTTRNATTDQLAETEYFVLYAEGWLEATDPSPLPNPWLNGWVEGKYGYSMDEITDAIQHYKTPTKTSNQEQSTIDHHLALSYIYEAQFRQSLLPQRSNSKSPKRDSGFGWDHSSPSSTHDTIIFLDPSTLSYTTPTIPETLVNGTSLYHLVTDLTRNTLSQDDIPPLRVFDNNGYWTLDNQQLWVVQKAKCKQVKCSVVDVPEDLREWIQSGQGKDVVLVDQGV